MASANLTMGVKGIDKTGAAFKSVKNRAKATGFQIRAMLGGAFAAAGAYLGLSAIKGGVDELGRLSDIAQKTNTSVDELTKTSAALSALGIQNMGVDQLAKSFDYLQKTTGRTGMSGFLQTIKDLGQIEDVSKRGQEAMRVFGRSGMEFMPLINGAAQSVDALQTVIDAMPYIPQSAANAGDAAADALGFAAGQVKSIWLQGLGFLANKLNDDYTGDVRTAALAAGNSLEYYTKIAVTKCIEWYQKLQASLKPIGEAVGAAIGTFIGGGGFKDAWAAMKEGYSSGMQEAMDDFAEIEKTEEDRTKRFRANYEARADAIKHFAGAYKLAAISLRKPGEGKNLGGDSAKRSPQVRNELIQSANEALRISAIGPQFQSETKKQTKILEKIAANTEKTANEVEKSEDLEVTNG